MSTIENLTSEQLTAELAARRQAETDAAAAHAAQIAEAGAVWDAEYVDRYKALDEDRVAAEKVHSEAFRAAVAAGDVNAALSAWICERSIRFERSVLRDAYNGALFNLGRPMTSELRHYESNFLRRLEEEAERLAANRGYDSGQQVTGQRP